MQGPSVLAVGEAEGAAEELLRTTLRCREARVFLRWVLGSRSPGRSLWRQRWLRVLPPLSTKLCLCRAGTLANRGG